MSNSRPIRRSPSSVQASSARAGAAQFLAKGLDVIATDIARMPRPSLRGFVKAAWPALERLGSRPARLNHASRSRRI